MTYSEEAEMSLLGSIWIKPSEMGQVLQVIPGETFFVAPFHRMIYKAYMDLHREGKPIDIITLKNWLESRNLLQDVGGEDYLIQLGEIVPSAVNAVHYANIVREKWAERTIIGRAERLISDYNTGSKQFTDLFTDASKITRGRLMPNQFAFEVGTDTVESDDYMEGLLTGFRQVDELTCMNGIPMGQLTVVGAYTGKGKSFFMQQVARHVAERDQRVAYLCFGGDLDLRSLRVRWIKQACGIFPDNKMTPAQKEIVAYEVARLKPLPIMVYESEQAADDKVETAIEWVLAEHKSNPFTLVVADYAQEMNTREKVSSGVERMETVVKRMASLAKEIRRGVILASQMATEDSLEFRYSQQFKHSSGLAIVLQRESTELASGLFQVKATVVKNRWGFESGTFTGFWNPKQTRFEGL